MKTILLGFELTLGSCAGAVFMILLTVAFERLTNSATYFWRWKRAAVAFRLTGF
jgi:hypothetical protein